MMVKTQLLREGERSPVNVYNLDGKSSIFLVCEHAGRQIPRALGDLGVSAEDRSRHIAWDIGAEGVSRGLSERLDAPLITQTYSRLVCDCNRATHVDSFMPAISERTPIPGNRELSPSDRMARIDEIYRPFHDRIKEELDRRQERGQATVVLSIHSFTPVFMDEARPMHLGLLYDKDPRLAHLVGGVLRAESDYKVVDNEPYALDQNRDFTIPEHGERRGVPSLEIEIRQDLIESADGQAAMADCLAPALLRSADHLLKEIS